VVTLNFRKSRSFHSFLCFY